MKILFARIGWMKFYSGSQPGDERPIAGGEYNKKHMGGEIYNFKSFGSYLYGSFANAMSAENLNLSRIQPGFNGDVLKDVLIIFFAHRDKTMGQVVVGWYENATVTRNWQEKKMNGIKRWYWAKVKINDAVLLPTYNRTLQIPRGKNTPGQSNTFFIFRKRGIPKKLNWLNKVLSFIENYEGSNLLINPEAETYKDIENKLQGELEASSGQGMLLNSKARKIIEFKAMDSAIEHYESMGYSVENVSTKKSYDLECTKGSRKYFVEVKGSILPADKIILTPKEVKFAKRNIDKMKLFFLHSIKLRERNKKYYANGGKKMIFENWQLDGKKLKPIQYFYSVN